MFIKHLQSVAISIVVINFKIILCAGDFSVSLSPPVVTLALEFRNSTISSVSSVDSNILHIPNDDLYFLEMTCMYSKPVTWSLNLDMTAEYTIRLRQSRTLQRFEDPDSFVYFSTLEIKLSENLLRESNFTCHQTDFKDSNTQGTEFNEFQFATVVLNGQRNPTHIFMIVFQILQSFGTAKSRNSENSSSIASLGNKWINGSCKVTYWIKVLSLQKLEWNCSIPTSENSNNTITTQSEIFCSTEAHCALYQDGNTMESSCIEYLNPEDECEDCKASTGFSPSLLICEKGNIRSTQVLLYTPVTKSSLPQQIFPGLDSLDNNTMSSLMLFKRIPRDLILHDEFIIECIISEYVFSSSPVLGLKFANSQQQEYLNVFQELPKERQEPFYSVSKLPLISSHYDFQQNVRLFRYKLRMVERFWEYKGGLERIYCQAPVWNTDEWVFKSQDVVKLPLNRPEQRDENTPRYEGSGPKVTISPLYPSANLSLSDYLILHSNLSESDEWNVRINCTSLRPIAWRILYSGEEERPTVITQLHRKRTKISTRFNGLLFHSSLGIHGTGGTSPFVANCFHLNNQLSGSAVEYSSREVSTDMNSSSYTLKPPTFQTFPFFTASIPRFQENPSPKAFQYTQKNTTSAGKNCAVSILIKVINSSEGKFDWKCFDSQNSSATLESRFSYCNDYLSCHIQAHYSKNSSSDIGTCLKVLQPEEACDNCISSGLNRNTHFTRLLACRHPSAGYLYQFVHKFEFNHNLHFRLPDRESLMHIDGVQKHLYVGEEILTKCSASPFAFSRGLKMGIIFGSGIEENKGFAIEQDYINTTSNQIQMVSNLIVFKSLKKVICFAPRTDSVEFTNISIEVKVHDSKVPAITEGDTMDNRTFITGGRNETLLCEASGIPKPVITWSYPVSTSKNVHFTSSLLVNQDRVESTLLLKYVLPMHSGVYKCMATSVVGNASKYFNVNVIDLPGPNESGSTDNILLISGLSAIALLFFSIMIYLFWRIWFLQISVKSLSNSDIKQFREGLSSTEIRSISGDDAVNSIIYCQPYNHTLEISRSRIQIDKDKKLGEGNFGFVCFGYLLRNHPVPVALKLVKPLVCLDIFKSFLAEIKVLAYLGEHPNIVNFHGACTSKIRQNDVIIVIEFCENGSIKDFLSSHRDAFEECLGLRTSPSYENTSPGSTDVQYGLHRLLTWCFDVVNACDYLETKRIVHGDLASRNVLLTETLQAKISDFGLARVLSEHSNYAKSPTECPLPWKWLAPESLTEKKFSSKSDVWSFGITLWEIFALGEVPYPGVSWSLDFINLIKSGLRPCKPNSASDEIFAVMSKCWEKRPEDRPTFNELKQTTTNILSSPLRSRDLPA